MYLGPCLSDGGNVMPGNQALVTGDSMRKIKDGFAALRGVGRVRQTTATSEDFLTILSGLAKRNRGLVDSWCPGNKFVDAGELQYLFDVFVGTCQPQFSSRFLHLASRHNDDPHAGAIDVGHTGQVEEPSSPVSRGPGSRWPIPIAYTPCRS